MSVSSDDTDVILPPPLVVGKGEGDVFKGGAKPLVIGLVIVPMCMFCKINN